MTDLPEPLTPHDCDLRDFPFMPLEVARFRDSDLASLLDPEARWANVMAWAASWHQLPAASLPNDDTALCRLLGYGRDVKGWVKIRAAGGLRGWIECADGRLYHPVVAEKALEAWGKKQIQRKRSKAGNDARWGGKPDPRDESSSSQGGSKEPSLGAVSDPQGIQEGSHKDPSWESRKESLERASRILELSQGTGTERETVEGKEPSLRSGQKNRGSRLPDGWQPDAEAETFATDLGLEAATVAASFRDFWHSKPGAGGVKLDWAATWRNWCRRDAERRPAHRPGQPTPAFRNGFLELGQELFDQRGRPTPEHDDLEPHPFRSIGGPHARH